MPDHGHALSRMKPPREMDACACGKRMPKGFLRCGACWRALSPDAQQKLLDTLGKPAPE